MVQSRARLADLPSACRLASGVFASVGSQSALARSNPDNPRPPRQYRLLRLQLAGATHNRRRSIAVEFAKKRDFASRHDAGALFGERRASDRACRHPGSGMRHDRIRGPVTRRPAALFAGKPSTRRCSGSAYRNAAALRRCHYCDTSLSCGISGLVKNALDLTEDLRSGERVYLDGRAVGIITAAFGWQGGGAVLSSMRAITHALRGWPTPLGAMLNTAGCLFDTTGACTDEGVEVRLKVVGAHVAEFCLMRRCFLRNA